MATSMQTEALAEKERVHPAESWKDDEEQVLPKNRLGIVLIGFIGCMFLASLDQTIVATALPTIVAKLGGGSNYSWVGSAYMLGSGAIGPLYGKLADMFGRKPILHSSIFLFLLGSALCGAAQNMTWLIVCRAVQGVGGGGIMQLVVITISDIVPMKDRGWYSGSLGATYGVASVIGPLLGGAFSEHVSWRWCFFINLPTGGISALILLVFLNLNPHVKRPLREQVAELDFIGLVCLVAGVVCLLVGLDFSQDGWTKPKTLASIIIGVVLLIVGGINEMVTTRSAIIPARLFKNRTTAILIVSGFIHAYVFFGTSYYLPLFYQVLGASATGSGIKMLPFSLGISISSIISGLALSRMGRYRLIIWISFFLSTLGMGLLIMLDYDSSIAKQEVFPLIASIGLGCLFQVPIVAIQAAMPLKDMATASSGYLFLRVGGAIGITVGEAIITGVLPKKLSGINLAGAGFGTTAADLNQSVGEIHLIPNMAIRDAIMHACSQAIDTIWIVSTPLLGAMLILTLFLHEYPLDLKAVQSGETKPDLEQATHDSDQAPEPLDEHASPMNSDAEISTKA